MQKSHHVSFRYIYTLFGIYMQNHCPPPHLCPIQTALNTLSGIFCRFSRINDTSPIMLTGFAKIRAADNIPQKFSTGKITFPHSYQQLSPVPHPSIYGDLAKDLR
ncbi:MAG: hypothetical protein IJB55_07230 [Firmicutes bacterium]|nr:hypothetical protein [Bacillota bacterium]